jgi:hemoglobin
MNTLPQFNPRVEPGVAAGVTEEMIHQVVHAFYATVRPDPAIGPIFDRVIGEGWDAHLAKMCDFWSSVLLMTGRFKGTPMAVHVGIGGLRPTHFARWLHLFRQTVQQLCPPEAAALFVAKSEMIAQSLQFGIAASRGEPPSMADRSAPPKPPAPEPERAPAALPRSVRPYRRTPDFTEQTVPAALLKAHTTKDGVWGLIHVLEGRLAYRIEDPRRPSDASVLVPGAAPGVVEPTILHAIEPLGPVRFFVEFHRREEAPSEPDARAQEKT